MFTITEFSFIAYHHAGNIAVHFRIIQIKCPNAQEFIGVCTTGLAVGDGVIPGFVYIIIKKRFKGVAVSLGICSDNDLIGFARASFELIGVKELSAL